MSQDDDSDDDGTARYRQSAYSLDDTIVMEAKEKGKELYSNLSLPDRKKTLDDMVRKAVLSIINLLINDLRKLIYIYIYRASSGISGYLRTKFDVSVNLHTVISI